MRCPILPALIAGALFTTLASAQVTTSAPKPVDLAADAPPTVMTGSPEERNAAIEKALNQSTIQQINLQDIPLESVLRFLQLQTKIDINVEWEALAKVGVTKDTKIAVNLKKLTLNELLRAYFFQARPTEGGVGFAVENGQLKISPQSDSMSPATDRATQTRNSQITTALSQRMLIDSVNGQNVPLSAVFQLLSTQNDINLVVDWKSLEKAGANRDTTVNINATDKTIEQMLQTIVSAMKLKDGAISWKVEDGLTKLSTEAVLKPGNESKKN